MVSGSGGNHFNFHLRTAREAGHLNSRPRRKWRGEVFRIDRIHGPEIGQVCQKHGSLYHVAKVHLVRLEYRGNILANALGLFRNIGADDFTRCWIERDLAGGKE